MEQQHAVPNDASGASPVGPLQAARSAFGRTAEISAMTPQTLPSRYLAWTVAGCSASFVLGIAIGGDGWSVERGAMAGGIFASALVGGLAGYALGWRTHLSVPLQDPRTPAAALLQVTHEDVIGSILEPLNELNRELCRDMEAGELDRRVKGADSQRRH